MDDGHDRVVHRAGGQPDLLTVLVVPLEQVRRDAGRHDAREEHGSVREDALELLLLVGLRDGDVVVEDLARFGYLGKKLQTQLHH